MRSLSLIALVISVLFPPITGFASAQETRAPEDLCEVPTVPPDRFPDWNAYDSGELIPATPTLPIFEEEQGPIVSPQGFPSWNMFEPEAPTVTLQVFPSWNVFEPDAPALPPR